MSSHTQKSRLDHVEAIHHYYMEIINALPDSVYWVDKECNLKGCNRQFKNLLGLKTLKDFQGSPYDKMREFAHWDHQSVEELKLDDMNVIFSGKTLNDKQEKYILDDKGHTTAFQICRTPMYDNKKEIIGLVISLTPITQNRPSTASSSKKTQSKKETKAKIEHLPTVLMVEDNIIAQNVEKALLTALKCKVDIAETADIAVELFSPGKYDLVLMDIGLEDSSGYVVAKQLRQKEKNTQHHVPIIALTGYEADIVKYDCQHYFMEGAISKPLTSEQAEQIIKHYVYHMDVPVHGLKSI